MIETDADADADDDDDDGESKWLLGFLIDALFWESGGGDRRLTTSF
jgi:hypothetical protein